MADTTTPTLYRVRDRSADPWKPIPASALAGCLFARRRVDRPAKDYAPEVECYCHNPACVVRYVAVDMKLDDDHWEPERYRCPACGKPMEKQNYREWVTLAPVDPPAP
jgi:hypothetical protein